MSTAKTPSMKRRAVVRQAIFKALRTTVRIHLSHPLCPEPSPEALKSALNYSGNGSIDVYRYQDKQVLAYYATLPSKKLYERLLNTEVGVYSWKWKYGGLAEGANPLFALPEPIHSRAADGGPYGVITNATPLLPWEPLCLFPLLDPPGPSWICHSRKSLGEANKYPAHKRRASGLRSSYHGTQSLNRPDEIYEEEYEEEEEELTRSILDLVPRDPIPSITLDPENDNDRKCAREFEKERQHTLGVAAFIGLQAPIPPKTG
ncbi:hypothetical protein FRC04_008757 [Tulasnella sp. 424]|nr:hypothetical protein FRC04_008757 [Tulasnella sp. 424]KAG8979987.1 hypothetical protein FRC05_007430 [Tulasnella sp. 425]